MTSEEIFKKNFPQYVTEKGVCLSPFWDLFDAGFEVATSELNKGIIQVLTKENAELKERCSILDKSLITSTKNNIERQKIIDEIKEQLTKAEEIILKLSTCLEGHSNNNFEYNLLQEAKQFLKVE